MEYTTLKTILDFDDRDIHRLSSPNTRHQINKDSVPTFVLGTIISTIDSTYSNTPVFNLKNLDQAGLLDLNPQSAAQDDLGILMTSNKNAASSSNAVSVDAKASANFGGIIGAAAAAHYDQSLSLANSDGNIYVTMNRGKHGSYYEINTEDLKSGYDFTPFLIGRELNADEIKQYIDYKQGFKKHGLRKQYYINKLIFGGYEKSGLIDWDQRQIYGNIQLLTQMEMIFSLLLKQYKTFKGDDAIQNILYTLMMNLKYKISNAIQDFYAHVGTHFVSKLNFSNYAYGYGILQFTEASGNQESRTGVAVSVNGGVPSKFAIEGGTTVSYARQNGWANAMKNLSIEAHTRPPDVVEISNFAAQIKTILNDESKPLSVPNLGVPASPKVELPGKPDIKKKNLGPPESVFASYSEWKEYQADLKKDQEGKNKVETTIETSDQELDEEGPDLLLEEEEEDNSETAETHLYELYTKELGSLKNRTGGLNNGNTDAGSDILRIEDMFVSGFETTEYEAVIPSLRTSKIVLPKKKDQIDTYPNATRLLLAINIFRQLADYMNFISNFVISNIPGEFSTAINNFYDQFSQKGYDMVTTQMAIGKDIKTNLLRDFAKSMYGDESSSLCQILNSDVDRFHYVKYLLKPGIMYLWRNAPGGYAPFFFEKDQSLRFASLKRIVDTIIREEKYHPCNDNQYKLEFDLSTQITDTPDDIADLYRGRTESPFYPIFRYELKNDPRLLFLQCVGRYQLIYGQNGLIHPFYADSGYPDISIGSIELDKDTISHLIEDQTYQVDVIPDMNKTVINSLITYIKGFETDKINNNYALYFPDKSQTKELREANRVILAYDYTPDKNISSRYSPWQYIPITDKQTSRYSKGYGFINLYDGVIQQFDYLSGYLVKVDDGSKKLLGATEKFPVLLPIGYSKITGGYGSLLMGSSFGADNLIASPTYDAAVITSMHD